jgi:hypothetical protein
MARRKRLGKNQKETLQLYAVAVATAEICVLHVSYHHDVAKGCVEGKDAHDFDKRKEDQNYVLQHAAVWYVDVKTFDDDNDEHHELWRHVRSHTVTNMYVPQCLQ